MTAGTSDRPSGMFRAARPAQLAREKLAQCLGRLQDVASPAVDVRRLAADVAKAVTFLHSVQTSEPEDPAHVAGVRQAMDVLRPCLRALQDAGSGEPAVHETAAAIAGVMAILYPVAKAQERASMPSPPPTSMRDVSHDPRRAARRVAVNVDIGFQSDTNFYTGFSEDVSEGGLFVASYDYLSPGAAIAVNFTLPNGHLVSAGGIVRWIREYNPAEPDMTPGMGVQFADLKGEDRKAIEQFLRLRAPMFFEHG